MALKDDFYRATGRTGNNWYYFFTNRGLRYVCYLRILNNKKLFFLHPFIQLARVVLSRKTGIEIPSETKIGAGFRIVHAYNVTINPQAVIGKNVNIFKGATIGFAAGKRAGVPVIGNNVQIGINATIVGGVFIGDDVLIAPNAFVNFDVPSHSIVIGNPGKIIQRENATKDYVCFRI